MFKTRLLSGIMLMIIALTTVIAGNCRLYFCFRVLCAYLYGRISPGRKTYMVYAAFYGVFDLPDGSACIFLSEI